jgi:hypothetical protein
LRWNCCRWCNLNIAAFQVKGFHLAPQHHHHAFEPVVAGIAEFETVGAAELEVAPAIAAKAESGKGHGIVEKLHPLLAAGPLASKLGRLTRRHAVNPEPHQRSKKSDQTQFHQYVPRRVLRPDLG